MQSKRSLEAVEQSESVIYEYIGLAKAIPLHATESLGGEEV
jgi:hypothetical protein